MRARRHARAAAGHLWLTPAAPDGFSGPLSACCATAPASFPSPSSASAAPVLVLPSSPPTTSPSSSSSSSLLLSTPMASSEPHSATAVPSARSCANAHTSAASPRTSNGTERHPRAPAPCDHGCECEYTAAGVDDADDVDDVEEARVVAADAPSTPAVLRYACICAKMAVRCDENGAVTAATHVLTPSAVSRTRERNESHRCSPRAQPSPQLLLSSHPSLVSAVAARRAARERWRKMACAVSTTSTCANTSAPALSQRSLLVSSPLVLPLLLSLLCVAVK